MPLLLGIRIPPSTLLRVVPEPVELMRPLTVRTPPPMRTPLDGRLLVAPMLVVIEGRRG